ncbi:MAG: N-terminal phage integrase SAM-like domain-containing protein [Nocardioidaceae bacterium]
MNGVETGTYVTKTKQTLTEYVEEWLRAIEPTVRPSTHYSYARNLRLHVLPYLGTTTLHAVDAGMLNGSMRRCSPAGDVTTRRAGCPRARSGTCTPSRTGPSRMR